MPLFGKASTRGWKGFLRSFWYALKGVALCFLRERNLRFHLVATCYVIWLAAVLHFVLWKWIVLILLFALVLFGEMINTALEVLCDHLSPGYSKTVGQAKDIAAGGVLFLAAGAFAVGLLLFMDAKGWGKLLHYFSVSLFHLAILLFSIFFAVLVVDGRIFYKLKQKMGLANEWDK